MTLAAYQALADSSSPRMKMRRWAFFAREAREFASKSRLKKIAPRSRAREISSADGLLDESTTFVKTMMVVGSRSWMLFARAID